MFLLEAVGVPIPGEDSQGLTVLSLGSCINSLLGVGTPIILSRSRRPGIGASNAPLLLCSVMASAVRSCFPLF